MKVSEFLKSTRKAKGLSLREVETLSGGLISHPFLSQQESGHIKSPSLRGLYLHSKALGLDPAYIFQMAVNEIEAEIEAGNEPPTH